jgi:transposase
MRLPEQARERGIGRLPADSRGRRSPAAGASLRDARASDPSERGVICRQSPDSFRLDDTGRSRSARSENRVSPRFSPSFTARQRLRLAEAGKLLTPDER